MSVDYNEFVDLSPQGSLFHKTWWLDAVAQNNYKILTLKSNDKILAAWPLYIKKLCGLNLIMTPRLTPKLGILFAKPSKSKYSEQLSYEMGLVPELLKLLPKHSLFCQHFAPEFTNWLPLYWNGFKQTTRYTYVIEDLSDLDKVWNDMRSITKRKVKKAQKYGIKIVFDLGLEKLLDVVEMTYKRQNLSVPFTREYVRRIDKACAEKDARKMIFAIDDCGQVHAAVYIVYDHKSAYYLLGGSDPAINNHCGHFLAIWEAIKFASGVSKSFDFEGSMHSNIESVFRGFGGVQKPYMEITGGNCLVECAYSVCKSLWRKGGTIARLGAKILK